MKRCDGYPSVGARLAAVVAPVSGPLVELAPQGLRLPRAELRLTKANRTLMIQLVHSDGFTRKRLPRLFQTVNSTTNDLPFFFAVPLSSN